jgi:hypothetical protein
MVPAKQGETAVKRGDPFATEWALEHEDEPAGAFTTQKSDNVQPCLSGQNVPGNGPTQFERNDEVQLELTQLTPL